MKWTLQLFLNAVQASNVDLPTGSIAYLKAYDIDAFGGIGMAELTTNVEDAITWDSPGEAIEAWRARSTVRPTRGDGKPNRPLTSYTASPIRVEEVLKGTRTS